MTRQEKRKELVVTKPVVTHQGQETRVSFFVKIDGSEQEIWYRTQSLPDADYSNVALAATLLASMKLDADLKLAGAVSPKLLESSKTIQEIYNFWDRDLKKIKVIPNGVSPETAADGRGVASFFSGGVDSFYTLLKNIDEITAIILIHGFDFQPDFKGRESVVNNIRKVAQDLGKSLIEVETNVRLLGEPHLGWYFYYGSVLASVALLLSSKFKKVYEPSAHTYNDMLPSGSHVLTDRLWSTEAMRMVTDGCEVTRVQKVTKIIQSNVGMKYLRVCWENSESTSNCGRCEKCLRTMINLAVNGALEQCKTFSRPLDLGRVARIKTEKEATRCLMYENLEAAKRCKNGPLVDALEASLDQVYYKGVLGWPRRGLILLKRKLNFYPLLRKNKTPEQKSTLQSEKIVRVGVPGFHEDGGVRRLSATIEVMDKSYPVYFAVKNSKIVSTIEPFVPAALLAAMKNGCKLVLDAPISERLYQALDTIQDIFSTWFPQFRKVEIIAQPKPLPKGQGHSVASFFSGGADSFYTVLENCEEISSLIFNHGFDIKLKDKVLYETVVKENRIIADSLGKRLVEVETNIRELLDTCGDWGRHCHGPALASVAALLSAEFRKVYIPASHTYDDLLPWASHPLIDPLWSFESLDVVQHGCDATRVEKVTAIAKHQVALDHLRVCAENRQGKYNCGICEKCIRTMINLKLAGKLEQCRTFNNKIELWRLKWKSSVDDSTSAYIAENLKGLEGDKANEEFVDVLRDVLNGVYTTQGIKGWPKRIKNIFRYKILKRLPEVKTFILEKVFYVYCFLLRTKRAASKSQIKNTVILLPPADSGNLGDEAILGGAYQQLKRLGYKTIDLFSYGNGFEWSWIPQQTRIYPAGDFLKWGSWSTKFQFASVLSRYESFYCLGADVLDGFYSVKGSCMRLQASAIAKRIGLNTSVVGFSVNNEMNEECSDSFKKHLRNVKIVVRDSLSAERLKKISLLQTTVGCDPAFLFQSIEPSQQARDIVNWVQKKKKDGMIVIGINANKSSFKKEKACTESEIIDLYVHLLCELAEGKKKVCYVVMPHDLRPETKDTSINQQIHELLQVKGVQSVYLDPPCSASDIKVICAELDLVVTGRLHLAICCLERGTPAMPVAYQGKVEGILTHFELGDLAIMPGEFFSPKELAVKIEKVLGSRQSLRGQILQRLSKVQKLSELNFELVEN